MTPRTNRLSPTLRRALILDAALQAATTGHYLKITRRDIADAADVAPTLVTHYFGTMCALRRTIMRHAVKQSCLPVIAQGLTANDRHALKADQTLRDRALLHARGV